MMGSFALLPNACLWQYSTNFFYEVVLFVHRKFLGNSVQSKFVAISEFGGIAGYNCITEIKSLTNISISFHLILITSLFLRK